jgi:hypothetical protein
LRGAGCVTCPAVTNLTCGHLFTRTWRPTRWDIESNGNNHVQCAACNFHHEEDSRPLRNYYIRQFGKRAYEALEQRSYSNIKMGYNELFELWESYKLILSQEKAA